MRRGVEEVFQLLIGVFTMALIATIAYQVLGRVQTSRCEQMWQTDVTSFANAITTVAKSYGTTAYVTLHGKCGRADEVNYALITLNDRKLCIAVCGTPTDSCYVVRYLASGKQGSKRVELSRGYSCTEITPYVYYLVERGGSCDSGFTDIGSDFEQKGFVIKGLVKHVYVRSTVDASGTKSVVICAQKGG